MLFISLSKQKTMRRIKVRFSLQRGENYMKWKVVDSDGTVTYYKPCDTQLIMRGCTLKNNTKLSEKIFNGTSTKNVCGWILCESIEIKHSDFIKESDFKIKYNPKIAPFWMFLGENVDNRQISYIVSVDFKLCIDLIPDAMKLGGYKS
jgi:hypothetical protein